MNSLLEEKGDDYCGRVDHYSNPSWERTVASGWQWHMTDLPGKLLVLHIWTGRNRTVRWRILSVWEFLPAWLMRGAAPEWEAGPLRAGRFLAQPSHLPDWKAGAMFHCYHTTLNWLMGNEPPLTRPVWAVVWEAHSGGKLPEPPTRLAVNLYF